ncbi:RNA-directed DNA polymerase [Phytophthora palmivora]|uniref:RNA-directed DNA polymerase n=1 Tax=Phytophthora palmivora TaxID=4796 RepID=A0A2P4YFI2_9STRA|nr:RNA-directed DNA polymerase [Phytophthora palmivora]
MARCLLFFAEYNFRVEYKPGKLNVLANGLSRRADNELAHVSRVTTGLYDRIRFTYQEDGTYTALVWFLAEGKDTKVDRLSPRQRVQLHLYELIDGLLHHRVDPKDPLWVVIPNDGDLKYDIRLEEHDALMSGRLGRGKAYQARVKPSGHASAPLQSLPVPAAYWKSMSLDFVFGLPADDKGNTSILVFVCRLSKMVHLAPRP